MSNQIGRGTHATIVWFHEVPHDAFDLLPFKVSKTGSKSGIVKGVQLTFFRVGHKPLSEQEAKP